MKKDICKKCGKCCYYKSYINNIPFLTDKPCSYLDIKTNLCTIYKNRHKINPGCMGIGKAIKTYSLPKDCAYVENNLEYQENAPCTIEEIMEKLKK
jgi:hypothetical protein